ncbi:unnamed protein product [Cunninghamella echinulata]
MANIDALAQNFVNYYYQTFDSDKSKLHTLYREGSMLTFEGQQHGGANSITQKLVDSNFQKVVHKISTIDAQPSTPGSANIIVFVSGQLLIDGQEHPQLFSQTFQLIAENESYYVLNDIFRLIYG